MGNSVEDCRSCLFQESDFAVDFEDSKSDSDGSLCISGVERLLQEVGLGRSDLQYHTVPQSQSSSLLTLHHGRMVFLRKICGT